MSRTTSSGGRPSVVVTGRGHRHITATHTKTFELATDTDIGPDASCVVAVDAAGDWAALGRLYGRVHITVEAAGHRFETVADASPFWSTGHGLVVRKSDFRGDDTLAVNADAAAADVDRSMARALADDTTHVAVTVRLLEPAHAVLFTDRWEPRVPDGVTVVGLPLTGSPPLGPDAGPERASVLTRPGAAVHAAAALLGAADADVVLLGPLPRGKRARASRLDDALRHAAAVALVTAGEGVETERPSASAVFRAGEVVAPVRPGPPAQRLNTEDRVFTVVRGDGARSDVGPLLQALAAEGVSARTLRQAVGRVPGLDKEWDYDALLRLEAE